MLYEVITLGLQPVDLSTIIVDPSALRMLPREMARRFRMFPVALDRQSIAVLGDMLELGADAPKMHAELSRDIIENHIDLVFTAGQNMSGLV